MPYRVRLGSCRTRLAVLPVKKHVSTVPLVTEHKLLSILAECLAQFYPLKVGGLWKSWRGCPFMSTLREPYYLKAHFYHDFIHAFDYVVINGVSSYILILFV